MRISLFICVSALFAAPALAAETVFSKVPTDEEIRSGAIIDDGLDIPHIRPGTQYFEIHGSTRIARALGDAPDALPTGLVRAASDAETEQEGAAAW